MKQLQRFFQNTILIFTVCLSSTSAIFGQCPDPVITATPTPPCGVPYELSVGPIQYAAYLWSNGETTSKITLFGPLGTFSTHSVTVKCADGTIKTTQITIKIPNRVATMNPSLIRPCFPGDSAFISIGLGTSIAIPPYTFKVRTSNGDTLTILSESVAPYGFWVTPTESTSYQLISVVSASGCSYAIGVPNKVTVTPFFQDLSLLPTLEGDFYFCKGGSTTISMNTPLDPLNIFWGKVFTGFSSPTFTTSMAGSYLGNAIYTPQCTISIPFTIEEKSVQPEVQGLPVCSGNPTILNTTDTYVDYNWSNGDTGPTASVDQGGTYTVTVTDVFGCTGTDTKFVEEYAQPLVSIQGPTGLCTGQLTANLATLGFNLVKYEWSTGQNGPFITVNGPGSYTVTVTDTRGCTNSETLDIEGITTPIAVLTPTKLCEGTSAVITPTVTGNDVNYLWSNGATTASINVTATGLYRLTVSDPSLTCSTSTFSLVTVVPRPTVSIATSNSLICEGKTATLVASGSAAGVYSWSTGITGVVLNTNTSGNYTVTLTDGNGCTGSAVKTITVLPKPNPTISGPRSLCGKDSVQLSVSQFPIRQWSTGDSTTSIWVKATGTYNVQVTNAAGCTGSAGVVVTSSTPGNVLISGSQTLCDTDSVILVASGPFLTYNWSNGVKNDSLIVKTTGNYTVQAVDSLGCTVNKSISVGKAGSFSTAVAYKALCNRFVRLEAETGFASYQWSTGSSLPFLLTGSTGPYTVTVTNSAGCTGTASYNVTVVPSPASPNVAAPTSICPGTPANIVVTNSFQSIAWSTGSNGSNIQISQPGTYTVSVTDIYGCTADVDITVGSSPVPQPNITGSLSVCNGAQSELSVTGNYPSVSWSNGVITPVIFVSTAGIYAVTVTNLSGCTGTAAVSVTTSNFLSPNIAIDPYDCNNQVSLNAGTSYSTYQWSNGATTSTISVGQPGNFSLTVTDANGCIGTAVETVGVIPGTPAPAIQGANSFCSNATSELNATTGFNTYTWSTGANASQISVSNSGIYTVTVTDTNGCTGTATKSITAIPAPQPSIAIEPDQCNGLLTLNSGGPYASYLWDDNSDASTRVISVAGQYSVTVTNADGCTGTNDIFVGSIPDRPTVELIGSSRICPNSQAEILATSGFTSYAWSTGATTPNIIITTGGLYAVTVTNSTGCTANTDIQVDLLDQPNPSISILPYPCNGTQTLQVDATFALYEWSNGGTSGSETVNTPGDYTVTVTNVDGCTGTAVSTVAIPVLPIAVIAQNPTANYTVDLTANSGFITYLWSNGAPTEATNVATSGTYTVTVTDANGCTATSTTEVIIIIPPLVITYVPTLITCNNANNGALTLCINGGQPPLTVTSVPSVPSQVLSTIECAQSVSFSNITPGTFQWSVTDAANTTTTGSFVFTNPASAAITGNVSGNTISIVISGGIAPYQYSLDGTNYQNSNTFTNLPNATYVAYVRDANGCITTIGGLIVNVVGTNDLTKDWKVQILPNPSAGQFILNVDNCGSNDIQVGIWDVTGRSIRQFQLQTANCTQVSQPVDLSDAPAGSYLIQVTTQKATLTLPVVVVR